MSEGFSVGLLNPEIVCSLPKIFSSAFPSFSTSLVHRSMSAGVAASSATSAISPADGNVSGPLGASCLDVDY